MKKFLFVKIRKEELIVPGTDTDVVMLSSDSVFPLPETISSPSIVDNIQRFFKTIRAFFFHEQLEVWGYEGRIHRDGDLPAVIYHEQEIYEWYKHGKRHREQEGKPAYIDRRKRVFKFFVDNRYHREDGPAVIDWSRRRVRYYYKNHLHRKDGPAVIHYRTGLRKWYNKGRFLKKKYLK